MMGTDIELRDDRGDTPLNIAAYAGQLAAAKELLDHGADVNTRNNKVNTTVLEHWKIVVFIYYKIKGQAPSL